MVGEKEGPSDIFLAWMGRQPQSSVTRYFARQLLNKHAKNYQNVEKITKFLLSTKVVWKSITLSKTKSVKRFPSLKLCFFSCFSFSLVLFHWICIKWKYGAAMTMIGPRVPSPTGWVVINRIPSIQLDSLQFGCTALQAWTCNCSHWIFERQVVSLWRIWLNFMR
jgi:hypothetical protein